MGFYTADFRSSLVYESAVQKPNLRLFTTSYYTPYSIFLMLRDRPTIDVRFGAASIVTREGQKEDNGDKFYAKRQKRRKEGTCEAKRRQQKTVPPSSLLLCAPFTAKRSRNSAQASSAPDFQIGAKCLTRRLVVNFYPSDIHSLRTRPYSVI